jgi:DNA-binding NtrC family response regulator
VERLAIMAPGGSVGPDAVLAVLPSLAEAPAEGRRLAEAVEGFERAQIGAALAASGGNVARAATRLGLERSHLYKKMRKLGLNAEGS